MNPNKEKEVKSQSLLMSKILLVEDDENLGYLIKDNLETNGYTVSWAKNGEEGLAFFKKVEPEICLLDVMMPKMDGFILAEEIRRKDEFVPIIFLTAKSQEDDRLKGFEIGGDDYVTKPFSMKELTYRIEVCLRRKGRRESEDPQEISFGNSYYDVTNLKCKVGEDEFALTQMEGQLLKMLLNNRNSLVKREEILEEIWGENDYFKGRSLDVFITRLRKYLKQDEAVQIKNHHGVGFSLIVDG